MPNTHDQYGRVYDIYEALCESHGLEKLPLLITNKTESGYGISGAMWDPINRHIYISPDMIKKENMTDEEIGAVLMTEQRHSTQFDLKGKPLRTGVLLLGGAIARVGSIPGVNVLTTIVTAASVANPESLTKPENVAFTAAWLITFVGNLVYKHLEHDADKFAVDVTGHRGIESAYARDLPGKTHWVNDLMNYTNLTGPNPTTRSRLKRTRDRGNERGYKPLTPR